MEEHTLGHDINFSSFMMYASFGKTDLKLYAEDDKGRDVDKIILSKEQALKLAELIKQKYQ